jgi:hypothetical protein
MMTRDLEYLRKEGNMLLRITADCRDDMHEPDEQGLRASVRGRVFDNAGFDTEKHVVLTRKEPGDPLVPYEEVAINLATLIALARVGAHSLNRSAK